MSADAVNEFTRRVKFGTRFVTDRATHRRDQLGGFAQEVAQFCEATPGSAGGCPTRVSVRSPPGLTSASQAVTLLGGWRLGEEIYSNPYPLTASPRHRRSRRCDRHPVRER